MHWMYLTQNRGHWSGFVNTVMNFWFNGSKYQGNNSLHRNLLHGMLLTMYV
jgi:hypothetical protein